MPYFDPVSSLLQSVDSHGLWGGLTVGLPSALGSGARRRVQGRGLSEIEPRYAVRPHQCVGVELTRRRDCLMTPHFLIWPFGPKTGSFNGICHQADSMNRFYLDVKTGPKD